MKMRTSLKAIMILAGALFLIGYPLSAKADFVFDLNVGNPPVSIFPGPYAEVTVHLVDSTHATITFDSLTNTYLGNPIIYLLGGEGAAGVNVSGTFSLGSISGTNSFSGFTPGAFSNGGSGNEDGFGLFNQTITDFDGFGHAATEISFGLTATLGNSWATAADVLTDNNDGRLAAAHVFPWDETYTTGGPPNNTFADNTGFVSNGGNNHTVPEPGILILLGMGMTAVGFASRWIRKI